MQINKYSVGKNSQEPRQKFRQLPEGFTPTNQGRLNNMAHGNTSMGCC